jgi:hypothetical protein
MARKNTMMMIDDDDTHILLCMHGHGSNRRTEVEVMAYTRTSKSQRDTFLALII